MKLKIELGDEQIEQIVAAEMKDCIMRQHYYVGDGAMHSDDIKMCKKIRKAAKVILKYYT